MNSLGSISSYASLFLTDMIVCWVLSYFIPLHAIPVCPEPAYIYMLSFTLCSSLLYCTSSDSSTGFCLRTYILCYRIVLHILKCTVLKCTAPSSRILCCTPLLCTVVYCFTLAVSCTVLDSTIVHRTLLSHIDNILLCCVILSQHCTVLPHHTTLCDMLSYPKST